MKLKLTGFLLALCAGLVGLAASPRITEITGKTENFSNVEIICDSPCPTVRYAAEELQRVLTKVLGKKPQIGSQPSAGAL